MLCTTRDGIKIITSDIPDIVCFSKSMKNVSNPVASVHAIHALH